MERKQITPEEALKRLAALCAKAEHCSGEMRQKLSVWGIEGHEADRIVDYLIDNRYIDDERWARLFALDKIRYSHWGRRKIEQAMWQKSLDKQTMRQTLDEIDDEEYLKALRPLIASKCRQLGECRDDYEKRQKLLRFVLGRGFSFEQFDAIISE